MPRYEFNIENGVRITSPEATEDLAGDQDAIAHAAHIARDFSLSLHTDNNTRVVVRDEHGEEVGHVMVHAHPLRH